MSKGAFRLLFLDTLTYVMHRNGIACNIEISEEEFALIRRVFTVEFGDAIFYYRESIKDRLQQIVDNYPITIFTDIVSFSKFCSFALKQVTKQDSFLMDVIRTITFYVDIAMLCDSTKKEFLSVVVKNLNLLYESKLKFPLKIAGFSSLFKIAEQLLFYRNLSFNKEDSVEMNSSGTESVMLTDSSESSESEINESVASGSSESNISTNYVLKLDDEQLSEMNVDSMFSTILNT